MVERKLRGGATPCCSLLDDRNRFLTSILIGNTIVLLAADSVATLLFIHAGIPNAAVWSTAIMTVLLLLFGEIVPKTIAVAHNERWALRLAPVLERVAWLMTPVNATFLFLTNSIVRVFGVSPAPHGPFVTEDDIRNIVNVGAEQKVLEEQEREMIHSIIEFGDTIVREVMTPRPDMVPWKSTSSPRRALDLVIAEGYSKIPVFEETIDNVIGVVHDRELLISAGQRDARLRRAARADAPRHATSRRPSAISELLREMQRGKFSLAIVVDEYGGTAGLVTMEDLLEEIVGEIRDEHDEGEEEPIRFADGEAIVDAGTNIEDVNAKLGTHLPHEEFETIGGLTVGLFGRLPSEGEEIEAPDRVKLRIDRMRGRRILSVRVDTPPELHLNGRVNGVEGVIASSRDGETG